MASVGQETPRPWRELPPVGSLADADRRILKINDFNYVTRFVVEAARGGFSHWFVEYGTGRAPQGGLAGGIHTRSKGNGLRSYSGLTLGMPSSAITALGVDVETASDL